MSMRGVCDGQMVDAKKSMSKVKEQMISRSRVRIQEDREAQVVTPPPRNTYLVLCLTIF